MATAFDVWLCDDNKLCLAEVDARARGTWFFQMDIDRERSSVSGPLIDSFVVYSFAPTLKELGREGSIDLNERASFLFTVLDRLFAGEAMSFTKPVDATSTVIAEARRSKQAFKRFGFTLKKFSGNGGTMYRFGLEMFSVSILDIQNVGAAENVLVTYRKAKIGAEASGNNDDPGLGMILDKRFGG